MTLENQLIVNYKDSDLFHLYSVFKITTFCGGVGGGVGVSKVVIFFTGIKIFLLL